jgi:hypothetical protein
MACHRILIRVTRLVSLVEQELLTLLDYMSSPPLSILLHFKRVGMIIPRYQHVPYGALGEPECILLHYKRFCLEKNPPYKRVHYTVQSDPTEDVTNIRS